MMEFKSDGRRSGLTAWDPLDESRESSSVSEDSSLEDERDCSLAAESGALVDIELLDPRFLTICPSA